MAATHIHNLCPHPVEKDITPHELFKKTKPSISYLRVFGCDAFGLTPEANRSKLDFRALKYAFIGYSGHQKGYKLNDPKQGVTKIFKDVVFNESSFGDRSDDEALSEPCDFSDDEAYEQEPVPNNDDESVPNDDDIETRARQTSRKFQPPERFGDLVSTNWIHSISSDDVPHN